MDEIQNDLINQVRQVLIASMTVGIEIHEIPESVLWYFVFQWTICPDRLFKNLAELFNLKL